MWVEPESRTRADKRLHQPALDTSGSPSSLCHWSVATLSSPAGDILVLRVAGEVDSASFPGLDAALHDVLDRRPYHLLVDLTGLVFCSSRGVAAIARTARMAAANGIRYSMSGAPPLFTRVWPRYWPNACAPPIHRSTAAAVLSAIVLQAELWKPLPPTASTQPNPVANEHKPGSRPVNIRQQTDDTDPAGPTGGQQLRPDTRDTHRSALRRALRQRSKIDGSALNALGASPSVPDLAAQLRSALARFTATPPDNHRSGHPDVP